MKPTETAQTRQTPGTAGIDETKDWAGRAMRPRRKTKPRTGEIAAAEIASVAADTLPPLHPALVEMVRLLARADARRAQAGEQEMRK
jgi:hypothetical protein